MKVVIRKETKKSFTINNNISFISVENENISAKESSGKYYHYHYSEIKKINIIYKNGSIDSIDDAINLTNIPLSEIIQICAIEIILKD
jgi:hypothetical protein